MTDNKKQPTISKELINKFFDCAETAIESWIAKCFSMDVKYLFPEHDLKKDILGISCPKGFYDIYLDTERDTSFNEEFLNYESVKQSCSMLWDAVQHVYSAVAKNIVDIKPDIVNYFPIIDNADMSFELKMINTIAIKRDHADKKIMEIQYRLRLLDDIKDDNKDKMIEELLQEQQKQIQIFNSNDLDSIQKMQSQCDKFNNSHRLYFVHKPIKTRDHLPVFGISCEDA